jgi:hypothetical protein
VSVRGLEGLALKGVLIDFGGTLAYLDGAENRTYETARVLTLNKYGDKRHLKGLDSVLAGIYVSSTKGELKSPRESWSLVLMKMGITEQLELIKDLENVRSDYAAGIWNYMIEFPRLSFLCRRNTSWLLFPTAR